MLVHSGWRALNKSTLNAYTTYLSLFCKFHNTDPDQLIQLNNSAGQLKTMVLNYIIHLKKIAKKSAGKPKRGELSVNSIILYLKGVKSFLEFNEIALPWNKIVKFLPDDVTNSYRSYTKEDIMMIILIIIIACFSIECYSCIFFLSSDEKWQ